MHLMRKLMCKQHQPAFAIMHIQCKHFGAHSTEDTKDTSAKCMWIIIAVAWRSILLLLVFFLSSSVFVFGWIWSCCFFFYSVSFGSLSRFGSFIQRARECVCMCVFCHQTVNYGWIHACNLYIENMMARENHIEKWLQLSSQLFTPIAL